MTTGEEANARLPRGGSSGSGRAVARLAGSHVAIALAAGLAVGAFASALGVLPSLVVALGAATILGVAAAAVVGNVERLLLAVVVIDISFPIDKYFGYRREVEAMGGLGGLGISLTTIAIVILYGLWIADALSARREKKQGRLTVSVPLALYLAFVAVAATGARDTTLASFELMLLVQTFLVFVYIANRIRTRSDVRFMVVLLVAGLALQAFMSLWLRYTGQDLRVGGLKSRLDVSTGPGGEQMYRLGGTVGSPNTAAAYFTLLIAPALALLLTDVPRRYKQLAFLAFPLGAAAVILTLSRGGWIALGLSTIVFCAVALWRGWLPMPYFLVIGAIFAVTLLPFHDVIGERLTGSDRGAAEARVPLNHLAWNIIRDHPLTGLGTNNFSLFIDDYATPEFSGDWLYTVHNKYLLLWAELGIGGLLAFLWFLAETLRKGWACVKSADPLLAPLGLGFTVAIVGQMAHMFFDVFHSRPQVQSLWVVAAVVASMYRITMDERVEAAARADTVVRGPRRRTSARAIAPAPGRN